MRHPDGPQSPAEQAWADQFEIDQSIENGYRIQQATRPKPSRYAIDGYVLLGLTAWILEKIEFMVGYGGRRCRERLLPRISF